MTEPRRRRTARRRPDGPPPCPWCGEPSDIWVDASAGEHQRYVEDCAVCCHPCVVVVEPGDLADDPPAIRLERE